MALNDWLLPECSRVPIIEYGMFSGNAPSVTPDNYKAGFDAGTFYARAGDVFSGFYLISPERVFQSNRNPYLHIDERWKGVCDALKCFRIPPPQEIVWNIQTQHVTQVRELLQVFRKKQKGKPVLFLVTNHPMAEEVALCVESLGMRIPEDVSILSFVKRFEHLHRIQLDNFDFNHADMAGTILDELDLARSGHVLPSRILLPMRFYRRGSCIPAFYRKNGIN